MQNDELPDCDSSNLICTQTIQFCSGLLKIDELAEDDLGEFYCSTSATQSHFCDYIVC